jgi:cell division protein FtsW (lipid II flippase)
MLTAIVGVALVLVAFAASARTRRFAAGVILALAIAAPIGIVATAKPNATRFAAHTAAVEAQMRRDSIVEALRRLPSRPFGAGFGSTGAGGKYYRADDRKTLRGLDNLYFAYLYETGPIGLAALLLATGWILVRLLRRAARTQSLFLRCFCVGLAAAECGMYANGLLSQAPFDYAPVAQIFWLLAGTLIVPSRILTRDAPCPSS